MLKLTLRIIIIFLLTAAIAAGTVYFNRAGDSFLSFIARALSLNVSYTGHCDSVQALLFRAVAVKGFKVSVDKFPVAILCDTARLSFDFSGILNKKEIGIRCFIDEPKAINLTGKDGRSGGLFLDALPPGLFEGKTDIRFTSILADFTMYGDSVNIRELTFLSKELMIYVSGVLSSRSSSDVEVKIFLSPEFLAGAPEGVLDMLEPKKNGWYATDVKIFNDPVKKLFKAESDTFRFVIGNDTK